MIWWLIWAPCYLSMWWWGALGQRAMWRGEGERVAYCQRWAMLCGVGAMATGGLAVLHSA